jgi:tetratricopeptide (TPR) repeat protein
VELMDVLRTTSSRANTAQTLEDRHRTNYARAIFIASLLLFSLGELNAVAGFKLVTGSRNTRTHGRIPSVKTDLSGTVAGLKIVGLAPHGPAAYAGLKHGDVLIAYNKRPIINEEGLDAIIRYFQRQYNRTGEPVAAELSLYRNGEMTVRTFRVPIRRLGIYTHEWTFAGAFVEEAVTAGDYASAAKHVAEAAASGQYTTDQILRMRMHCLNDEKGQDKIRQVQVDELYRRYTPETLRFLANDHLLFHKRYHAAAAVFERYLKIKRVDVATEVALATCYTEIGKYDEADALITKILARRPTDENAATEYIGSALSDIRARVYMGRGQYDRAQDHFQKAWEEYPDSSYYALAFLYCAARRDATGEKPGEFEAAYRLVSARLQEREELMGYHIDALRAFVLVKRQHLSLARATVARWLDSPEARRYVPNFWRSFPHGAEIIENWYDLVGPHEVAVFRHN